MTIENKPKRKRGRPPKKPIELPPLKTDAEKRDFLIQQALQLNIEMIEIARKKNNIKNPNTAKTKTQQYRVALEGIKITNALIKSKQLDDLEAKFNNFEIGLIAASSEETKIEYEKLNDDLKKIKEL